VSEETVFTSDGALLLKSIPEWVAIIGSGYIGLEFSDVYTALGAEVTFIEAVPMLMPTSDRETAKQAERMLIKPRSINFRLNVFASEVNTGIPGEKPVTIKMIDATTKRQNTTKELGRAEAKLLRQRAPSPNYSYDRNTGSNRRATSNHEKEDDYIMSLATSDASSLSRSSLRNKQRQGINLIVDHAKLVTNEELNAQRNSNSKQENMIRTRSRQEALPLCSHSQTTTRSACVGQGKKDTLTRIDALQNSHEIDFITRGN